MDDEIQELSTNEVLAGVKVPDSVPKIPAPDTDNVSNIADVTILEDVPNPVANTTTSQNV